MSDRTADIQRQTHETDIDLALALDAEHDGDIETGVPFLDHMLNALARHGHLNLSVSATGDAAMDPHHSVEDVGIAMGQALKSALGDRAGITRFGHAYAPLDEALARVVVDCSGRPFLEFHAAFPESTIGQDFAASLVEEFFRALAVNGGLTVHIDLLRARNSHHAAEAIFKAAGLAIREAVSGSGSKDIPSTKGMLA